MGLGAPMDLKSGEGVQTLGSRGCEQTGGDVTTNREHTEVGAP